MALCVTSFMCNLASIFIFAFFMNGVNNSGVDCAWLIKQHDMEKVHFAYYFGYIFDCDNPCNGQNDYMKSIILRYLKMFFTIHNTKFC